MSDTFECALCHRTYPKVIDDAEAEAEYEREWGKTPTDEEDAVVCEDCFQLVMGAEG